MALTTPIINIQCINCSCMSAAFKQLTLEQLQRVDLHRSEIPFKKGEILCKQGTFMSNMMFVKNGLVKRYIEHGDHPMVMSLAGKGHFLGLSLIFGDESPVYHYSAQALTDTEICQVNIELFREFIRTNHEFAQEIIRMLSEGLISAHEHTFTLTQKSIMGRFAKLLLYLKDSIYKSPTFDLTITRKDMADLISTSAESLSRMLKELNTDGVIKIDQNHLEILDEEKLKYIYRVG